MPRPVLWSFAFFTLAGAQSLGAQALRDSAAGPTSPTPLRRATLLGGIGNSLGWLGGQGEIYFTGDRYSLFGAVGYTPSLDQGDATGVAFAGGFREYFGGGRSKAFFEISVTQLIVETDNRTFDLTPPDFGSFGPLSRASRRLYGPTAQLGFQFRTRRGFTLMAAGGVGYVIADPQFGDSHVQPTVNLGLGYTWAR